MKAPDLPEGKPSAAAKPAHFYPTSDLFPEPISDVAPRTAPIVSGQRAQVLELIRKHQPLLSFVMTADHAIPEAAARVCELRNMGFYIVTRIVPAIEFRGCVRSKAATYSMGIPEWPAPGFFGAGA